MTTLTIRDLTTDKELDRKALSEVIGGNAALAMAGSLGFDLAAFIASPVIHNVANDQINTSAQVATIGGGNVVGDGVFAPVQFQIATQSNYA